MIKLLVQEVMDSILSHPAAEALLTVKRNKAMFLDPVQGVKLHAEALFFAIKHAELPVVEYLCRLPVHSSISFFKFCGQTPLSLALVEGRLDLLPVLLANTDKNFALHMAVNLQQEKVKALLLNDQNTNPKLIKFLGLKSTA